MYYLLSKAIETGAHWGINRFFKHRELAEFSESEKEALIENILHEALNEISEMFIFDDEYNETIQ